VDGASGLTTLVANLDTDRHHRLVAVDTDGYLTESTDGSTWTPTETLPDGFPVSGLSYVGYDLASNPAIGRMVVLGQNQADADTMHVAWSKLTTESTWGNLLLTVNDASCLPRLKQVAMISYDHKLYAFGGASQNGSTEVGAFGSFYVSEDGAVSWTAVTASLFFPEEFPDLYDEAGGTFAYVVDENDYLWILWGGQTGVWRSRVNRLGFDK
jgi:hypothetical protein